MKQTLRFLKLEKIDDINTRFRHGRIAYRLSNRIILFFLKLYIAAFYILLSVKFYKIITGGRL